MNKKAFKLYFSIGFFISFAMVALGFIGYTMTPNTIYVYFVGKCLLLILAIALLVKDFGKVGESFHQKRIMKATNPLEDN